MDPIFHLLPDVRRNRSRLTAMPSRRADLFFVTGQLATDPVDDSLPIPAGIEAQTHKVMDNLIRVLRVAG